MQRNQLPIPMTQSERVWGIRYLLFQLVFLPSLIALVLHFVYPGFSDALLNFLYFTIDLVAVVWIFRRYLKRSLLHFSQELKNILPYAICGYILYWILNIALSLVITLAFPDHFNVNDAGIAQMSQGHFWLIAIGSILMAPVTEELLYRGLIFGTLHRRNRLLAYAISMLVFCAIHVGGYVGIYPLPLLAVSFLQYLPGGFILAWAYEKSGNILCPVLIHMAINTAGTLSMR